MSTLKLFLGPLTHSEASAGRKRPSSQARVTVETLEGRALLSHVSPIKVHAQAAQIVPPPPQNLHPGPILNLVGNDHAVKSPRFYPYFTGVKRAELNAAGSWAKVDSTGTVTLSGIVAGNIITNPTSPAQNEFYIFGINRGGATSPGPFPGRPGITFDGTITVAVTNTGITGTVTDLNSGVQTAIPAADIQIKANTIHVVGAVNQLTTTGSGNVTVNFWTATTNPSVGDYNTVSSFVPEFRSYPIVSGPWVKTK